MLETYSDHTHRFIWYSSYILYKNNPHPLSYDADRMIYIYIYIYICVCVCVCVCVWKTSEKEKEGQNDKERKRKRECIIENDREKETRIVKERETETETDRQTETEGPIFVDLMCTGDKVYFWSCYQGDGMDSINSLLHLYLSPLKCFSWYPP